MTNSPSGQDLYFFNRASSQDNDGDLWRLPLKPGVVGQAPNLIELQDRPGVVLAHRDVVAALEGRSVEGK